MLSQVPDGGPDIEQAVLDVEVRVVSDVPGRQADGATPKLAIVDSA
jgi:hypothetical protein